MTEQRGSSGGRLFELTPCTMHHALRTLADAIFGICIAVLVQACTGVSVGALPENAFAVNPYGSVP